MQPCYSTLDIVTVRWKHHLMVSPCISWPTQSYKAIKSVQNNEKSFFFQKKKIEDKNVASLKKGTL